MLTNLIHIRQGASARDIEGRRNVQLIAVVRGRCLVKCKRSVDAHYKVHLDQFVTVLVSGSHLLRYECNI